MDSLRIALVHYHLRPGGVTSVVVRAVAALARHGVKVAVLTGEATAGSFPFPVVMVPGLGYGDETDGAALADALQALAASALGGSPHVWHIHNHALGKNVGLPRAVAVLAERGERLLLQLHDFAEDGRPGNYRVLREAAGAGEVARCYPVGPRVHYALLNQRDHDRVVRAGGPPACVHLLPNPVVLPESDIPPPPRGVVLYPTRAIRRKNIGEFLLGALLDERGRRWQTTLEPTASADQASYTRWQAVARELGLPVDFAVGVSSSRSLPELLAGAEAVFTASVAEGFGLSFLEPWLAGRPVFGRDLPGITADFKRTGLDLGLLYSRLLVPVAWVGLDEVRSTIATGLCTLRAAYGRDTGNTEVEAALAAALGSDGVDFGCLNEALQERVLRRVASDAGARAEGRLALAVGEPPPGLLAHNRRVVQEHYGEKMYGQRLFAMYQGLSNAAEGGGLSTLQADTLLDQFLDPAHFNLLRTS